MAAFVEQSCEELRFILASSPSPMTIRGGFDEAVGGWGRGGVPSLYDAFDVHVLTAGGGRKRLKLRDAHTGPAEAAAKRQSRLSHTQTHTPDCRPGRCRLFDEDEVNIRCINRWACPTY